MSENESFAGDQPLSQQQSQGDIQVYGNENTFNTVQAGGNVTITQTKIIQISVDEIKQRTLITVSPYKGLRTFEPEDNDRFFGRDQFLAVLVNELEQTNLVLLLGASGSGKSSVVRAGLLPWLQQKWGNQFKDLIFTPDNDPFDSLYGSLLAAGYKQSEAKIARTGTEETFSEVVQRLKTPESFWLIFVDQFEELFTVTAADKRDRFISSLVKLCEERANDPSIRIVATMRADFLDQLDPAPANQLARLTQKHRPLITQMQPDELRLAIEQPAAHHGVVLEKGLADEIMAEVQGRAGYLPLLQYTLDLLWETEAQNGGLQDHTLNTLTYRRLGGVRGALQKRVDQIYLNLLLAEQQAAQRIFLKLVQIGTDEAAGTEWKPFRRRADLSEFATDSEKQVLRILIDAHLLVSGEQDTTVEDPQGMGQRSTVEIAHEVLLTSWTQLNDWIRQYREAIALRNRLYDDVKQWKTTQSDDELWTGRKLDNVVKLRSDPEFVEVLGGFHEEANEFITASANLVYRKQQEQKQRDLKVRIAAGDDRRAALMELLEACTVKLCIPGQSAVRTGFFVAPGKILTCAPEILRVGKASNLPLIKVNWKDGNESHASEARVERFFAAENLAILRLSNPHPSHPCVDLDSSFQANDPVCTYGYSDAFPKGGYAVGTGQKQKRNAPALEFETYPNSLELQSSPLLNWRTLKVCGIVRSTHDHTQSKRDRFEDVQLGKAISAASILSIIKEVGKEQHKFHSQDRRWRNLLPPRCKPRTVALAGVGMASLVILVRAFSVFVPVELFTYDFLMRTRLNPPKASDRFLIIKVTEKDLQEQQKNGEIVVGSLSNVTLDKLLGKVEQLEPIAVGLDIYRDQPLDVGTPIQLTRQNPAPANVQLTRQNPTPSNLQRSGQKPAQANLQRNSPAQANTQRSGQKPAQPNVQRSSQKPAQANTQRSNPAQANIQRSNPAQANTQRSRQNPTQPNTQRSSQNLTPPNLLVSMLVQEQNARRSLQKRFADPELFTVCKTPDSDGLNEIPPPPNVKDDRLGFSDVVQEPQAKVVRRQYLSLGSGDMNGVTGEKCKAEKSFNFVLAKYYLEKEGIQVKEAFSETPCQVEFSGSRRITGLLPNTGGYQGQTVNDATFAGCQILLNYREKQPYESNQLDLASFLNKSDADLEQYKKRIVLIGVDRSDGGDLWKTPYDQTEDDFTIGVVLQAQMIDQIIDAALKDNAVMWVLPTEVDLLLILLAGLVGAGLGWWILSPRKFGLIILLSGGGVLIISFVAFQFGGWIPLMPHFLAFSTAASYTYWMNQRVRHKSIKGDR